MSPTRRHRLSAKLAQTILDSIQEGVWLVGADGVVQFANARLAHLWGVGQGTINAGKAHGAIVERLKGRFRNPDGVAARWHELNTCGEQVSWDELELLQPCHRFLERFVRPLNDGAQRLVGRLEIYRDVTAQRQLEQKAIDRERLAALGQFVSGVAHELNNPLTTVCGYAQLLQRHPLPDAARLELERLAQQAERAGRIIKNLLLFARPSKPERVRVSVQEILEKALELRAYEMMVENISIQRRYARALPAVWADPHQLQQVFLNILLNAEQAISSTQGRGTILLETSHRTDPERVRVDISDDGPGVDQEDLPHLFEPFFTTKGANQGTGLGLSISLAIVKEHNGEIYGANRAEGGATLSVELPAAPITQVVVEVAPTLDSAAYTPPSPPRVLVVDDERPVAQLIADVLHQQGYEVEFHTDSRAALREAMAGEFDLLICDIKMPQLDGETFYRRLLQRGHPLAARILFTTGDTLARKTNDFLERVGLPCLSKPFLVEELKLAVRNLLAELAGREA